MGLVDWFRGLWKLEEVDAEPTFQEEEAKAVAEIEEQYGKLVDNELTSAFDTLQEDEEVLSDMEAEPAPDYDVGETSVDDLLSEESTSLSYYHTNTVEAKIEGSDTHLKGVAILGDIPTVVDEAIPSTDSSSVNLEKMKKAELVKLAKDRGLATSGTKVDIIARLKE